MARPRHPYRIYKKPGNSKLTIEFWDHLDLKQKLTKTSDKSTAEYLARNIVNLVNIKISNQPLTPEMRQFIGSRPKIRKKLLQWGILDSTTTASFEPLMIGQKEPVKHSRLKKFNVTGGHLYHWQKSMQANERSSHHIKESVAKVARIIRGCRFITPSDINGERFTNWMSDLRNKGKSISCINGYLISFKSFTRWMLRTGRISENPIQYLQPLKKLDKIRPRRALLADKVNTLITATAKDTNKHHGLTGYERSLVYRLGLDAGLRYNEIYSLKRGDIVTVGDIPCVTVKAGNAKNRKQDILPLTTELAKELSEYFAANLAMPHIKAFSGLWKDAGAAMLREDLKLAGIPYKTDAGVADFHSLRHTFGTITARSGVMPQVLQKLMRHSDINLTMKYYVHIELSDKAKAINRKPKIKILKPKQAKTGTCDVPENLPTVNPTVNYTKIQ